MKSKIVSINLDEIEKGFPYEEALRTLRTNLQFSYTNFKVLLFTSSIPGEGVADISFQLAVSMSKIDRKVLYIDANIRKSNFTVQYQINDAVNGINQFLSGMVGSKEIIYSTNIKNLDVVFTGPSVLNSTELLYKFALDEFISEQKIEYDYIITAAPPLADTVDAAVIGRCVDGAVIVVRSGKVSRKLLNRVKLQLEKVSCKVIGVVLNGIKLKKNGYK